LWGKLFREKVFPTPLSKSFRLKKDFGKL